MRKYDRPKARPDGPSAQPVFAPEEKSKGYHISKGYPGNVTVVKRKEHLTRGPLGQGLEPKEQYSHKGYGRAADEVEEMIEEDKETVDVLSLKEAKKFAIMQPELLMEGKYLSVTLSVERFHMREFLDRNFLEWFEDEATGVTTIKGITLERAKEICREYHQGSMLFVDISDDRDAYYCTYLKFVRDRTKILREFKVNDVDPLEMPRCIGQKMRMRLPEARLKQYDAYRFPVI